MSPWCLSTAIAPFLAALWWVQPVAGEPFRAGSYSFSDELGGFRILSVRGTGTQSDPIILEEEILDTAPVTLVIRRLEMDQGMAIERRSLTLKKIIRNSTRRIWGGFELELQEILFKPSVYGDGLSFNQMDIRPPDITSDRFARNNRVFEPHDRVRFESGHVDPGTIAHFSMVITDPTPIPVFYLVQDPQLLFAGELGPINLAEIERGAEALSQRRADPPGPR